MTSWDRAYPPGDTRQQRTLTLVFSEADIRRAIALRAASGLPCNLLLASNITAASGFTIPATVPAFSLDGGGKFKVIANGAIATLFACRTSAVFRNVSIQVATSAAVTTLFEAADSGVLANPLPLVVEKLQLLSDGTVTNIFGISGSVGIASANRLVLLNGSNLFREDRLSSWFLSSFTDVDGQFSIGVGSNSPALIGCRFEGFLGVFPVYLNIGSRTNVFARFLSLGYGLTPIPTIVNATSFGNVFYGIELLPTTLTLSAADIYVERQPKYAAGTLLASPGYYILMANHLSLSGAQRATLQGNARLRIT